MRRPKLSVALRSRRVRVLTSDLIIRHRVDAAADWAAAMSAAGLSPDVGVPMTMPGCFVDRYGFAFAAGHDSPRAPGFYVDCAIEEREEAMRRSIIPTRSLGGWVADPDAPVEVGAFYDDLLSRWTRFADRMKLPTELRRLSHRGGRTWRDAFADTVFYPRPPVMAGPNFFDQISEPDRQVARARYGERCAIDFFCFMQQVHETVHASQVGEPLLNEVVQAALWTAFLDDEDMWVMQTNSRTGRSCVRELELVRRHPELHRGAAVAGLDTARLIDSFCCSGAYYLLCAWARAFDDKQVRYGVYLEGVGLVLGRPQDEHWIRAATAALERRDVPAAEALIGST